MPVRSFFRFLTLLLGIFYLDTVCQTDTEDARAYYARGIPEYIVAAQPITLVTPVNRCTVPVRRLVGASMRRDQWRRWWLARTIPYLPTPAPWPKRWLRCRMLRV